MVPPTARRGPVAAVAVLLLLAAGALASCTGSTASEPPGSGGPPDGEAGPVTEPDADPVTFEVLDGRTFRVTSIVEDGAPRAVVARTSIDIGFREIRGQGRIVTAEAGCNHMGGAVAVADGRLVVDTFGGTLMLCQPELVAQDAWVAALLQDDPAVELDGRRLRLDTASTVVELEELDGPAGGSVEG